MAVGKRDDEGPMAPVHLFSHGSTMMLGEESASADYWKKCGDEALAHGVEHVVMMVSSASVATSYHRYASNMPISSLYPLSQANG